MVIKLTDSLSVFLEIGLLNTLDNILLYGGSIFLCIVLIALITLFERKQLGSLQRRKGPATVGFFGLIQAFVDAVKLMAKESIILTFADKYFWIGPMVALAYAFLLWALIPFENSMYYTDANLGILLMLYCTTGSGASFLISGWASNSKYALMGSLRTAAQMFSYEIALSLLTIPVIVLCDSFNLIEIVDLQDGMWIIRPYFIGFCLMFICISAEVNRTPFDLPEAESELVSGYNVEYSSIGFIAFFLAEYSSLWIGSILLVNLFFGGYFSLFTGDGINFDGDVLWLTVKVVVIFMAFVSVRGTLPRVRYEQLITFGWQSFVPFCSLYATYIMLLWIWGGAYFYEGVL